MSDILIITQNAPELIEVVEPSLLVESAASGDVTIVVESTEVVIVDATTETLVVEPEPITNVSILTVGEQGPPGAGGDGAAYTQQLEWITADLFYRGDALPDTLTSAPNWRVCRVTIGALGEATVARPDGSEAFDKTWDARAGYDYI